MTLEEEQDTRASLEEKLESFEELNNEIIANLTKERDHAIIPFLMLMMLVLLAPLLVKHLL